MDHLSLGNITAIDKKNVGLEATGHLFLILLAGSILHCQTRDGHYRIRTPYGRRRNQ